MRSICLLSCLVGFVLANFIQIPDDYQHREPTKPISAHSVPHGAKIEPEECKVKFEVFQVQDSSDSFKGVIGKFTTAMDTFVSNIQKTFPGSKYGISMFSDKQIPFSGYGDYGGYVYPYIKDTAYSLKSPLTDDPTQLKAAMDMIMKKLSGGADYRENLYGALLSSAVDSGIGFSETVKDADENHILRVMVVVTDALPHEPGDAQANIQDWNDGFGNWDKSPYSRYTWLLFGDCVPGSETYKSIIANRKLYDEGSLAENGQEREWEDAVEKCGPFPFPEPNPVHPNEDDSNKENAMKWEYPSLKQALDALSKIKNVIPVTITPSLNYGITLGALDFYTGCKSKQGVVDESTCLREYYREEFRKNDVSALHYSLYDEEDKPTLQEVIEFAMTEIQDIYCGSFPINPPSGTEDSCPPCPDGKPDCCLKPGEIEVNVRMDRKNLPSIFGA